MATKPIKTWVDTLFNLMPDEQLVIRKTINHHLSITYKKQLNREWFRQAEVFISIEDIRDCGSGYITESVNKMLEETRN